MSNLKVCSQNLRVWGREGKTKKRVLANLFPTKVFVETKLKEEIPKFFISKVFENCKAF